MAELLESLKEQARTVRASKLKRRNS